MFPDNFVYIHALRISLVVQGSSASEAKRICGTGGLR